MAIRINAIPEPDRTVIKIDGRLQRVDMDELVRMLGEVKGPVVLDLAELQSIDRQATALLRELVALGVELQAASPYVDLLLKGESDRPADRGPLEGGP